MTFKEITDALERRGSVSYYGEGSARAQCPAHQGERMSLSVWETQDGKRKGVGLKCWSKGCSYTEIMAAIERLAAGEVVQGPTQQRVRRDDVESEWVYELRDITGRVVATHVRLNLADGSKVVFWRGGLGGRSVTSLPLFGSDILKTWLDEGGHDGEPIYLCEGEKDTLAAWERGLMAVGTVTGAHSIPDDDVLRILAGHDVVLCRDNDSQGQEHMNRIAARLEYLNRSGAEQWERRREPRR